MLYPVTFCPKEEETEQKENKVNANGLHPFKSEDLSSLIKVL